MDTGFIYSLSLTVLNIGGFISLAEACRERDRIRSLLVDQGIEPNQHKKEQSQFERVILNQ